MEGFDMTAQSNQLIFALKLQMQLVQVECQIHQKSKKNRILAITDKLWQFNTFNFQQTA
jgi:hypothetical protein